MNISLESRLQPDHEIRLNGAVSVVEPAEPESKQGPSTTTPSRAESLLAAEKRTLELMANGASLSEVLNDRVPRLMLTPPCSFNGLFDGRRQAVAVCRAPCPRHI